MITVVGSLNMDVIACVAHLPAPGETVSATGRARVPGGKGANQAVAAARAGAEVHIVGRAGEDAAGDELVRSLEAAGVNTGHVVRDATDATGTALIAVDGQGENTIIVMPGVNARLTPEDVDRAADIIAASDFLLVQLEVPMETVEHAAQLARSHGTTVILNPSPARELPPTLLRTVDIVVSNEAEVAAVSGMGFPINPSASAEMLLSTGPRVVVVTMGERGAAVVDQSGMTDILAYEVEALDTTGAGDAFAGNLAAALDSGAPLLQAAAFASAAAALSVQQSGAQQSMPSRAETERLIAESRPA